MKSESNTARSQRPRARRVRRNVALGVGLGLLVWAVGALVGWSDPTFALSMGTGYVGLLALAVTMLLGPANVLRARPNPVSTYLRRDWGIWSALLSLAHFVVGIQRHFGGDWVQYFVFPDRRGPFLGLRYDPFGLANWTGLGATLLIVVLLAVSNDRSLAALGVGRWKAVQRTSYVAIAAVAAHGALYQLSSSRSAPWVVLLLLVCLAIIAGQLLGVRSVRRSSGERAAPVGD